jgi:hypothetical protein
MLQRFASTAFVAGTLLTALLPAVGLARDHGGYSGGGRGGSHSYTSRGNSGGNHYSGGQHFASPRSYSGGRSYYGGGYAAPRSYRRPGYRGYYRGGFYAGYGYPYGYAYDPGYYYGPAPQACPNGYYDRYGNWVPDPRCYSYGPQYPPQQSYYPSQQQAPPPQQYYDPNQRQGPPPQQDYDPNQDQPYGR